MIPSYLSTFYISYGPFPVSYDPIQKYLLVFIDHFTLADLPSLWPYDTRKAGAGKARRLGMLTVSVCFGVQSLSTMGNFPFFFFLSLFHQPCGVWEVGGGDSADTEWTLHSGSLCPSLGRAVTSNGIASYRPTGHRPCPSAPRSQAGKAFRGPPGPISSVHMSQENLPCQSLILIKCGFSSPVPTDYQVAGSFQLSQSARTLPREPCRDGGSRPVGAAAPFRVLSWVLNRLLSNSPSGVISVRLL